MRIPFALILAAPTVLLSPGCQQHPPLARNAKAPAVPLEPRNVIPPERQPSMVGDYLVYPCQWRRADELAAQLRDILYPKYGPWLRIVPDYNQNALLIYIPPQASRHEAARDGSF